MNLLDLLTILLLLLGAVFFAGGTLGLLRFPDSISRIHTLAKADTLGLGFVIAGLMVQAPSAVIAAKLLLIWILAMFAGSIAGYLVAQQTLRQMQDRDSAP